MVFLGGEVDPQAYLVTQVSNQALHHPPPGNGTVSWHTTAEHPSNLTQLPRMSCRGHEPVDAGVTSAATFQGEVALTFQPRRGGAPIEARRFKRG